MNTPDEVARILDGMGLEPHQKRNGEWEAQCPAHDDNRASLGFKQGDTVPTVFNCLAGCTFNDIVDILTGKRPPVPRSGQSSKKKKTKPGQYQQTTWYDYKDESGRLLYQHGRTVTKEFPFRTPGHGYGLIPDCRRVLYHLPELAGLHKGSIVFVVEGEKDADRIKALGFTAVCNDNGAGQWKQENYWFEGHHVCILPDNDDPGRKHADEIAAAVYPHAASVKIVALPDLPEKGDVSDFLDAGYDMGDVLAACADAPFYAPESDFPDDLGQWPDHEVPAVGAVLSIRTRQTVIAPLVEGIGSIRDNDYKKHRWITRFGEQIIAEAKHTAVYMKEMKTDYQYRLMVARMKSRRGNGRIEWRSVPLVFGGRLCFHTDGGEGGTPLPLYRPELYLVLQDAVENMAENGRAASSADWGREYTGAKGNGKDDVYLPMRCELAVAEAMANGQFIETDIEGMSVKAIRQLAGKVGRDAWAGMLDAELRDKQRKSVMNMLRAKIKPVLQIFSRESIIKIAAVLEARLNKGLIAVVRKFGGDVIGALKTAGIDFITRHGHELLTIYEEYFLSNKEHDPGPIEKPLFLIGRLTPALYGIATGFDPPNPTPAAN